jgi:Raf kinase inhibitor-like YbhB/YbcL family protein
MQLTSPAFQNNSPLPADYTCHGRGVNPPLAVTGVPGAAQSLAIIMHDPDAIGGQDFLHWAIWNIDPKTAVIAEASLPKNAHQGMNDYPKVAYGPACPPAGSGLHHYTFDLYALDAPVLLPDGADRKTLEDAIKDHVMATAQLVGIVQA